MPFIIIIAYLFYLVVVLMHSGIAFLVRCKSLKRRHAYGLHVYGALNAVCDEVKPEMFS